MPPRQGEGEALRRIGPYRIERRLGAGGMGVVYLGRHHETGAAVAVKVIKPEYAADAQFRARLRREVAAARRVPRFCTAPVVGADLDIEPPYIATEYIGLRWTSPLWSAGGSAAPTSKAWRPESRSRCGPSTARA